MLKLLPEFETPFERKESIAEKCVLRFPALPFIPPEPYDVIRTDYTSYALVQGANDTSFVQVYARTPNPGDEFLKARLKTLKELGYSVDLIKKTPQVLFEFGVIKNQHKIFPLSVDLFKHNLISACSEV